MLSSGLLLFIYALLHFSIFKRYYFQESLQTGLKLSQTKGISIT